MQIPKPKHSAQYFQQYIDQAVGIDIIASLEKQGQTTAARIAGWTEEQGNSRYAPGKWSVKEVLGHIADGERIFAYRLLWIVRGGSADLPGFDQDPFVTQARFDQRSLASIAQELQTVRAASVSLLRGLPDVDWDQPVSISGNAMTPGHIPWLMSGHELHHLEVLSEKYGLA